MTPRATTNSRSTLIESVACQLHSWKPFQLHQTLTLEGHSSKPYFFSTKKPCRSDRSTAPAIAPDQVLDLSRLSLREDPNMASRAREDVLAVQESYKRWFARKRRHRGSRSVSGRSSDRSVTRVTLMSAATCSDSSGDLPSWGSDVSEVHPLPPRRHQEGRGENSNLGLGFEKELGLGFEKERGVEGKELGNESGYGSEPGYRGDGELGYGDEFDDDEDFDSGRFVLCIGVRAQIKIMKQDANQRGIEGGNQRSHHRCRRKKHDWRVMAS